VSGRAVVSRGVAWSVARVRYLVLISLVVGGCSSDPLKADVEMFCNATVGTDWKWFDKVGPYAAERAKTDEFKALLLKPVHGEMDIWQFADGVRALMKKTGVTKCKTLDDIVRPQPS
jgi:hypothetical protein